MDPDSGHLVDISQLDEEEVERLLRGGHRQVPKSHLKAAALKLAGRKEAKISLTSGGKLSCLCAQWRKEKRARYIKKLGNTEINRRREQRRK